MPPAAKAIPAKKRTINEELPMGNLILTRY
jgi:hypothetical protein